MISPYFYERFSLPYLKEEIREIHRLGKKAIVIYYGGIEDRVEQIVSSGADAMIMECSMKNYTNDLETIGKKINGRMCIYGNLNPLEDIELANDEQFRQRLEKQISIGKNLDKFIISNGSPLTPNTSITRIRNIIDLAHKLG